MNQNVIYISELVQLHLKKKKIKLWSNMTHCATKTIYKRSCIIINVILSPGLSLCKYCQKWLLRMIKK